MSAYVFKSAAQVVKVYGDPIEGKLKKIVKLQEGTSASDEEHVMVLSLDGVPPFRWTKETFSQMWEEVMEGSGVYRPKRRIRYVMVPPGDQVTLTSDGSALLVTYPDCIGLGEAG